MTSTAKYTFDESPYEPPQGKKKHHRKTHSKDSEGAEDGDTLDGSGSLTYSAASSINSAAGESTDSSFADIMKVLDVQDSKEVSALIQKELARQAKDERSIAAESQNSLAYSTDAESHLRSLATDAESALNGTRYLPGYVIYIVCCNFAYFISIDPLANRQPTRHCRQPSDQFSDVGRPSTPQNREDQESGAVGPTMDSGDLLFSPAEHTDSIKRRKDRKRRERLDKTPRTKNTQKPEQVPVESRQGTPPTARPPKAKEAFESQEEEDVWYAKWWMFCFPDAVRSMTPKR